MGIKSHASEKEGYAIGQNTGQINIRDINGRNMQSSLC
jgi:hypothetical protein